MSLRVIEDDMSLIMSTYSTSLKYYQGRLCSCVGENNGSAKSGCKCNQGFYYKTTPEIIQAVKTRVSNDILHTKEGRIYNGGAQITIPKFYNKVEQEAHTTLAQGDIVVDPSKSRRDTDILIKGVRDFIFAFDVARLLSVYVKDKEYIQGVDFTVSEVNSIAGKLTHIIWENDAEILDNDYYTVEFICNEQYKVWADGGANRGTTTNNLPRKMLCVSRRYMPDGQEVTPLENIELDQDFN